MPRGAKSPGRCTEPPSDKVPRINLFKVKKIRGWWPFISMENNKNTTVVNIIYILLYYEFTTHAYT